MEIIFLVVLASLAVSDGRHVRHHHLHHHHHDNTEAAKKNLVNSMYNQFVGPQGGGQGQGCCSQYQQSYSQPQNQYSCCQTAPTPPPCCQTAPASVQNVHAHAQASCCQSIVPPQPATCCHTQNPPPCCSQPQHSIPIQGCCTTVQPVPTTGSSSYLRPVNQGNHCCQAPNPPPCCFGLHLKPGQVKNISMTNGSQNFILNVKLIADTGNKGTPTTSPTKETGATGSSTGPTGSSTGGPTSAPTNATGSGSSSTQPTSASTNVSPTNEASTTSGSSSAKPTESMDECQRKGLEAHNSARNLHDTPPLALDNSLNRQAQEYAEKLAKEKNIKHSPKADRQGQGENLALKCSENAQDFDCGLATEMWYEENQKYDFNTHRHTAATGHFTQVVWKATTQLGIGKASYHNNNGLLCWVVVARYTPAGNVIGRFQENVLPTKDNVLADQPVKEIEFKNSVLRRSNI